MTWEDEFRERVNKFGRDRKSYEEGIPISIKFRVVNGCFCENCCPHGLAFITVAVARHQKSEEYKPSVGFVPHESGPELLVHIHPAVILSESEINLVMTIMKARSEGEKKGDKRHEAIELIVRGFKDDGKLFEERVLRFDAGQEPSRDVVGTALTEELQKQLAAPKAEAPKTPPSKA